MGCIAFWGVHILYSGVYVSQATLRSAVGLGAELIMFDVSCRRLRRAERKVRLSLPKIIHRLEILLG